jgi:TPR repeat protein
MDPREHTAIDAGMSDAQAAASDEALFELGLMCSAGRSVPADLVSAHKWFNLAAMRGHKGAIRMRLEIAAEMSQREIAEAQRAARDWLTRH